MRYSLLITALVAALLLQAELSGQEIDGELKQWHNVTLVFDGPATSESADPNPFLDYRLNVSFSKGSRTILVPGYFAADGNAAETGAKEGNKWAAHFVPDETGEWTYQASFRTGTNVAVSLDATAGRPVAPDGVSGKLVIGPSDKGGRDNRGRGMLRYVGEHYARFAGTGDYFIQAGSQSPENFLAYYEFDDTVDHGGADNRLLEGLHRYEPHVKDWRPGDPTWREGKGKGIIGALNYLAGKGMNTFYSLTMNIGGDGREIYPWTGYDERARYDVSKLAQWEIVFSHMDTLGMQLMVITQEEENEQLLGKMTTLRKLYYRELIARFAHHHALLWDLSEEADRWRYYTTEDLKAICAYIKQLDPWQHPIQYVQWKGELVPDEKGYGPLLGYEHFDGTALQHDAENTHAQTLKWVEKSAAAGHKWLVGIIEVNPTSTGVLPDAENYWHDRIRKNSIWGNLMAGGSGSVFFFGYAHPNSDLDMEDWRSRDHLWDLQRYAHEFFTTYLPFHEMRAADGLTPAADDFVFAKPGEVYAIYLPGGGSLDLDLSAVSGAFDVRWFDPRHGGGLRNGDVSQVQGGGRRSLGNPPTESGSDWAVLVRRAAGGAAAPIDVAERLDQPTGFHVKLGENIGSRTSRVGDPVTAVVISPERFLGRRLEGVVDQASAGAEGVLRFTFSTLEYNSNIHRVTSTISRFVNSKGHPLMDEQDRQVRVTDGVLRSPEPEFAVDEGAEFRLQIVSRGN
jgi:uncharacterized protein DUF5060/collagenase-like protein with putative collagen-binding domain